MAPVLSVIVPVYKVEPYIRQCLDSLVNQTYQDMEIIVIDDGSPDDCGAICDEYAAKCHRMRVIHKQNAGVQEARNQGIDEAKGKWIAFVDSDDWCDTDYYESLFRALGDREVDVFCANGHVREYESGSVSAYGAYEDFEYHDRKHLDILMAQVLAPRCGELRQKHSPPTTASMGTPWDKLYRTDFLRKHGFRFDPNRKAWDDLFFNYLVFRTTESVAGCNVASYHYRQNSASIVHQYNPNRLNINYEFIDVIRKAAPEKMESPMFREALYARSINMMVSVLRFYYLNPSNPDKRPVIKKRVREMTRMPYFHDALYQSDGRFFTKRQAVMKHLLRQPFLWPLELAVRFSRRK